MSGLTKRQSEVLSFIKTYIDSHNFSPSYREIMQNFGLSSLGSVAKLIEILKRKGVLTAEKQCSRSISPTNKHPKQNQTLEIELPYIGYISAHNPIDFFPKNQTLAVPEFLVHNPENTYILRAQGNSFNEEMISDGDILIVEGRSDGYDGETILASTEEHSTIIKKYQPEGNYVRLLSQSPYTPAIIIRPEELSIQAVVVSSLRLY